MQPLFSMQQILIVEDDLQVADQLATLLNEAGFSFFNAYNPGDAVELDHTRFHIALVNGRMQDRSGRTIDKYIQQSPSFSQLPIIAINHPLDGDYDWIMIETEADEAFLLEHMQKLLSALTPAQIQTEASTRILRGRRPPTEETDSLASDPQSRVQQVAVQKTFSDLARSISAVLDLNLVLNKITDAAVTLTNAEEGLLLLPDEDGKTLYLRAMKGLDDSKARNFRIKNESSLVGQVFTTGKPILVADQGPQQIRTEYFVKSLLYVPMLYKGAVVGVLGVNNHQLARLFDLNDQELLLDLAAHAATAIENARLYEESIQQNRQLATLVEAGRAVNSTLSLSEVLTNICQQVIRALNINLVQVLVRQPDDQLRPLAYSYQAFWDRVQGLKIPLLSRPVFSKAMSQGAFFIVDESSNTERWREERTRLADLGATEIAVLPVRINDQTPVAAVELCYRNPAPQITTAFRAALRPIALELCALVGALVEPGNALPYTLLRLNAQALLERSGADWFNLWLLNDDGTMTRVIEFGTAVFQTAPYPSLALPPPCTCMLSDPTPTVFDARDQQLAAETRQGLDDSGVKTMLCLPLEIKGATFGVVAISYTGENHHFRQAEISLLTGLVTQAATALENARLYDDLQRSLDELQRTQTKLVETARLSAIGELAAVVAHQINNPLTTVIADAELLLEDLAMDDPKREGVMAIHRAGRRSLAVVKRLLSTSRREPGESPQLIELNETVKNTLELVTIYIERRGIQFHIALDPTPVFIEAQSGLLEDIWLNLLLNARDALDRTTAGEITLESTIEPSLEGATIHVIVRDNGPGIPISNQARIFDPFFTTKPAGEGTGLGLYICKQIADSCGGTIELESAPKRGANFHVRLPIAAYAPSGT